MEFPDVSIVKDVGEVAGFNKSTSKPYGRAILITELHGKSFFMYLFNE